MLSNKEKNPLFGGSKAKLGKVLILFFTNTVYNTTVAFGKKNKINLTMTYFKKWSNFCYRLI